MKSIPELRCTNRKVLGNPLREKLIKNKDINYELAPHWTQYVTYQFAPKKKIINEEDTKKIINQRIKILK